MMGVKLTEKKVKVSFATKLTERELKALRPKAAKYDVSDTILRGLCVRVQPTGSMTYFVRYWLSGKQKWYKLGNARAISVEQARALARKVLAGVAEGEDVQEERKTARHSMTLRQFLKGQYAPWLEEHRRTGAYIAARLLSACESFLDRPLKDLDHWTIQKWQAGYRAKKHVASGNRHLAYLRGALSRAVEWRILPANPLATVKPMKEDKQVRVRFLSDQERAALTSALDRRESRIRAARASHNEWLRDRGLPEHADLDRAMFADYLRPMILLALNTGLRRGELFGLEWSDISFADRTLTVKGAGAKSGRTRVVPLNQTAANTLEGWRAQTSKQGLVFKLADGSRFATVNTSWRHILKDSGISAFRWHDMRHDFASRLVASSVDLAIVREILGHGSFQQTLRYAHVGSHAKADAVGRLDRVETNVLEFAAAQGKDTAQ